MVKALSFKGDAKAKKRKRPADNAADTGDPTTTEHALIPPAAAPADDDEHWVSAEAVPDIGGPIIFVLQTEPARCIASDALGAVFTSALENMVDGQAGTAEPHEVRQVWIATRVVGTETTFTFKGHHGKYLGVDRFGIVSAAKEAVGPEETFTCLPAADAGAKFHVQTTRRTFLAVASDASPPELRGDADDISTATALRIRMQARFKPRLAADAAEKVRARISRKELEREAGRRLEEGEVRWLKRARREGNYHEAMLEVKVKGKHDKFA